MCGERAGAVCLLCDCVGARHVCPARFVCAGLSAAACIVNIVAGGAAVGGGSRMTDREKEESCGL